METAAEFQFDNYLRVSGAIKLESFDWSVSQPPLDPEALFCLGYMMDIEGHTIVYLRELLSTRVIYEPEITAFLSCWVYEELFHSLLLKRFLATQGVEIDDGRTSRLRRSEGFTQKLSAAGARLVSMLTPYFPAVHMTWGAINELSTLTAYTALIETDRGPIARADSAQPLLNRILDRIIKDERRHFAFYFSQARRRLRAPASQRLTRFILRNFWEPVGSAVRGNPDVQRLCRRLFPGTDGRNRMRAIDATIAKLPGLERFDLAERWWLQSQLA